MKELRRLSLSAQAGISNMAKSVYTLEMYHHKNSHTAFYTCKMSTNH